MVESIVIMVVKQMVYRVVIVIIITIVVVLNIKMIIVEITKLLQSLYQAGHLFIMESIIHICIRCWLIVGILIWEVKYTTILIKTYFHKLCNIKSKYFSRWWTTSISIATRSRISMGSFNTR